MLPVLESGEETLVGGQAVMEGVMMRAPHSYCVAVRKPNGEIVTEEQAIPRMSETSSRIIPGMLSAAHRGLTSESIPAVSALRRAL